jgi:hypothetical protein
MTFFDLHPIDPYEARFKAIATLVLLSELGVIGYGKQIRRRPEWRTVRGRFHRGARVAGISARASASFMLNHALLREVPFGACRRGSRTDSCARFLITRVTTLRGWRSGSA